ncbi:ribosome maturation factor RimM [Parapedobacter sp. 10938]|uniref:ribosome maturation factor RimM n=1 Tax=Parapedobacter flavus TaxID=3110225 RepID=UPI002DBE1A71|nr:ribosome maturation factor RimM [Parapedobacter sp. 10938]MEC3879405.1 ribosome maturation factor RimM [Parapedobacter sp. 10938]
MEITDHFYIGYISKTRGLKGEVQLFFEFDDYKSLELDVLFLQVGGKLVPYFVERSNVLPNRTAYLFFEDVDHIDAAKGLVRKPVYLPNDKFPERDPDDFRLTDLKGFVVVDKTYGTLGEIIEVHQYPQQYVAAVIHQEKEVLFPLTDAWLLSIDRTNNILEVDLPDGLIDIYS